MKLKLPNTTEAETYAKKFLKNYPKRHNAIWIKIFYITLLKE